METLLSLIVLVNLLFLIIGFFSPSISLFWYKKQKTRGKSALIYGVLMIVFVTIAISTSNNHSSLPKTSTQSAMLSTQDAEKKGVGTDNTETTIKYAKIGDEITVGNFAYRVNNIKFAKSIGSNPYARETADGIFLIIDLTFKNLDNEAHTLDDSFYKLTDDQGTQYSTADAKVQVAMSVDGKETLFLKEVNPHIAKKGYLVFEVPQKGVYDIHLSGGFWTGETYAVKLVP